MRRRLNTLILKASQIVSRYKFLNYTNSSIYFGQEDIIYLNNMLGSLVQYYILEKRMRVVVHQNYHIPPETP